MIATAASDFTELVLHCLAHLRSPGPEDLFDARYVEWVGSSAPTEHLSALDNAMGTLQVYWGTGRAPMVVQAWPELFATISMFREVGGASLKSLEPSQVSSEGVLGWLKGVDETVVEAVHSTLRSLAPSFGDWHRMVVRPKLELAIKATAPWLEHAVKLMPSLGERRIEQTSALGVHGRGLPSRILVGAALPFNELDARLPAILALHEESVHLAGKGEYAELEWRALVELSKRMQGAEPSLRATHARWLSTLRISAVLEHAVASGELDPGECQALLADPPRRATRLAAR